MTKLAIEAFGKTFVFEVHDRVRRIQPLFNPISGMMFLKVGRKVIQPFDVFAVSKEVASERMMTGCAYGL